MTCWTYHLMANDHYQGFAQKVLNPTDEVGGCFIFSLHIQAIHRGRIPSTAVGGLFIHGLTR